ncbi:MAG TPA: hypothetical protein VFT32_13435 [Candidatus Eisenbacteria bacterium]|nr:hypothetical protein [Candidatus Eisenbacteria bacterium]
MRRPSVRSTAAPILAAALALLDPGSARAGAWVQPVDRGYFRLAFFGMDSRARYDENGERIGLYTSSGGSRPVEYGLREVRGYFEFGLGARVTGYGSLAWKQVRNTQPTAVFETTGSGDLNLGVRYGLRRGAVPVGAAFELRLPTAYDETDAPALGAGAVDAIGRLLVGTSWGWGYTTGDVGYGLRGRGYRDEFLYDGELGSRFLGPLYGRAVVRGIVALGSGGSPDMESRDVFDPGLASPRSLILSGTLGCDLAGGLALEASFEHAARGRDALAGNGVEIALAYTGFVRPR